MHTELSSCPGTHLPEYIENVFGSALKLAGCLTRVHERGARFLQNQSYRHCYMHLHRLCKFLAESLCSHHQNALYYAIANPHLFESLCTTDIV